MRRKVLFVHASPPGFWVGEHSSLTWNLNSVRVYKDEDAIAAAEAERLARARPGVAKVSWATLPDEPRGLDAGTLAAIKQALFVHMNTAHGYTQEKWDAIWEAAMPLATAVKEQRDDEV